MKTADRIIIEIDVFTNSAKPDITGEIEVLSSGLGEPIDVDLFLEFPEDDIPRKLEIRCSGPVISFDPKIIEPESEKFESLLILDPTFTDPHKHKLEVVLRHGIFYNIIPSNIEKEFSYSTPEIHISKVEAGKYRILPGENVDILVTIVGPEGENEIEIWGNINRSGDDRKLFLEKRKRTISNEHKEKYTVKIPETQAKGEVEAEIFLRSFGEKIIGIFNNLFVVSDKQDFSLEDLRIEPECIFPGDELTVNAKIVNKGTSTIKLSPTLHIFKKDSEISAIQLGETTLDAASDKDGGGSTIIHRIRDTHELEVGTYEITLGFPQRDLEKKTCSFEVTSGNDITIIGATVRKNIYSPDEPVHLRALFKTGPRIIDEEFTATATIRTFDGRVLARSDEVLEIGGKYTKKKKGEIEWVLDQESEGYTGPVNVTIEAFNATKNTLLNRMVLPYMFSIKGVRYLAIRLNKEAGRETVGGEISDDIKEEIMPYLFPEEKVINSERENNFLTVLLDNGTYLHLLDGKMITERETFPCLDRFLLYRIAKNMGSDTKYLEEMESLTTGILLLVENLVHLSSEKLPSFPYGKRIEGFLTQPGKYISELIAIHRKNLRNRIYLAAPRKKQLLKKRISSDSYVLRNLIIKVCKKEGLARDDIAFLMDLFYLYDDKHQKKGNKILKNAHMAVDKIEHLDPDFASYLDKNLEGIITELGPASFPKRLRAALGSLGNHSSDEGPGGSIVPIQPLFSIIVGLITALYLTNVIKGLNDCKKLENFTSSGFGGQHLYNIDLAYFHLYLLLQLLLIDDDHRKDRIEKASDWLLGYLKTNTKNVIRIIDETLRMLSNYGKNIKLRKMLRNFRDHVDVNTEIFTVEAKEGAVVEIPLKVANDSSDTNLIDMMVALPSKEFKLHWPPSKNEKDLYFIDEFRIGPGKHEIPLRVELPSSLVERDTDIKVIAYGRRGNLITETNSPFLTKGIETNLHEDIPSRDTYNMILAGENENNIPKDVLRHLIEESIKDGSGGKKGKKKSVSEKIKERGLLINEVAKDLGIRKERLLKHLQTSDLFKLSEVLIKGGFLNLKTIISHKIRFATTEELQECLLKNRAALLEESRHHPVSIVRVLSIYMKLLQGTKKVKKVKETRGVFTPGRPLERLSGSVADRSYAGSSQQYDKSTEEAFCKKIDNAVSLSGRKRINTFGELITAIVEMDPKELEIHLLNDDFEPFFDDSLPGKVLYSAVIGTRTQMELDELTDREIKEFLIRRIVHSPVEGLIFKYITRPKINNLCNEAKGQAKKTLSQLRSVNDSFTAPALSEVIFSLSKDVRPLVLRALGDLKDPRAVSPLGQILTSSVEKADRIAALEALISIGGRETERYIKPAIRNNKEMEEVAKNKGFILTGEEMGEKDLFILE